MKTATIDDLEFIAKCVKNGSLEKHFMKLTKNDIKLIIANQRNGSFLATIQSVNKQIGFLYIGKITIYLKARQEKIFQDMKLIFFIY